MVSARAAECGLGIASGLVGLWFAAALSGLDVWILQGTGGAEVVEGRSGAVVLLPPDAPWLIHAVHAFGPFLLTAAAFLAAAAVAWRLSGTASLAAASTAFWLAGPVSTQLAHYGWGSRGSLEILAQSIGIPQGGETAQKALALAAVVGVVAALRIGLRRSRMMPMTAFAIPVLVLCFATPADPFESRWIERVGIPQFPLILAVAVGLAAWLPRQESKAPATRSAGFLAAAGLLAIVVPSPVPIPGGPVREVAWSRASSADWNARFETARFPPESRQRWLELAGERLRTYRDRLGIAPSGAPIGVYVAGSDGAMRSLAENRRAGGSFAWTGRAEGALMAGSDSRPEDPRSEALLAMAQAWGEPASPAMAQAMARYAIGRIGKETLMSAAARIACEEERYSAETVFSVDGRYRSPLVRDALGGAWVEAAVSRHGVGVLPELYRLPLAESLAECTDCLPPCGQDPLSDAFRRGRPGYLKGISFSHEVTGGGYGSAAARRQLERMATIGASAVALVPYAFTRAPAEPTIRFRTLETDARLVRCARQARELGLKIVLKPHMWAGSVFHGAIEFERKERFDIWFDDYRRWMLHFARLAEVHRFDALVIGNELAGLTGHERAWRSLIQQVRRVYRGPLTYAAHWERELELISFWDELDWIGVNFYFPIAAEGEEPAADSPQIDRAAETIARVREGYAKPVLFTEVGFPALETAAARPWEENASALDAELQARCYSVWLERFARQPGVEGMFWWKWPSHGRGGPFDFSHSPLGKPSMGVLRDWFGRF